MFVWIQFLQQNLLKFGRLLEVKEQSFFLLSWELFLNWTEFSSDNAIILSNILRGLSIFRTPEKPKPNV